MVSQVINHIQGYKVKQFLYHSDRKIIDFTSSDVFAFFLMFRGNRNDFTLIPPSFSKTNPVSKQYSPSSDAAFCGISAGALLFAFVPTIGSQVYVG